MKILYYAGFIYGVHCWICVALSFACQEELQT